MKDKKSNPASLMRQYEQAFVEVVGIIQESRQKAYRAINTALIDLYWQVGEYISRKVQSAAWGEGVIDQLARYIAQEHPDIKGFTRRNLYRMKQLYETYRNQAIVSSLVTQLPWTHNLLILSKSKSAEEREFYLHLAIREGYSSRELERQIDSGLFERTILNPPKVSAALTQIHPTANQVFKDTYLLDFLNLPESHAESDLQKGLVANLKKFILELGRDFSFIGEEYQLQVGRAV